MRTRSLPVFLSLGLLLAGTARARAQEENVLSGPVLEAWRTRIDGSLSSADVPYAAVRDGDVVYAAGETTGPGATKDMLILAWDLESGQVLWQVQYDGSNHYNDFARAAALSPDGQTLYVGGSSSEWIGSGSAQYATVWAYDAASGGLLWKRLVTTSSDPQILALLPRPDGTRLYVGGSVIAYAAGGGLLQALSTADGSTLATPDESAFGLVRCLALSPDSTKLYAAGSSGGGGGTVVTLLQRHDATSLTYQWHAFAGSGGVAAGGARAIDVSPDGSLIYVGCSSTTQQLVAFSSLGFASWSHTESGTGVLDLAVSTDGTRIYTTGLGSTSIRTRAFASGGALLWTADAGAASGSQGAALDLADDEATLFVTGQIGQVGQIVGAGEERRTLAYDTASGALAWSIASGTGNGQADYGVALAAGGTDLAVVGVDSTFDAGADLVVEKRSASGGALAASVQLGLSGSAAQDAVDAVLSEDGTRLYLLGHTGTTLFGALLPRYAEVAALDVASGAVLWQRQLATSQIDPAGGTLAAKAIATAGGKVFVGAGTATGKIACFALDAASGASVWTSAFDAAAGFGTALYELQSSPDGARVYLVTDKALVHGVLALDAGAGGVLWYASAGAIGQAFIHPPSLAQSPDGSQVFLGGSKEGVAGSFNDFLLRAFDASSGALVWANDWDSTGAQEFFDHDGVYALAASPDGALLYATGLTTVNGTFKEGVLTAAFDAATGAALTWSTWSGQSGQTARARSIAVAPDGSGVFVGATVDAPDFTHSDWVTLAYGTLPGAPTWAAPSGAALDDESGPLAVDPDSSKVLAAGTLDVALNSGDAALFAFDADAGAALWSSTYQGPSVGGDDRGRTLHMTPDGGIALLGAKSFSSAGTLEDLLVIAYDLPELTAFPDAISLAAGGTQSFDLAGHAAHAGEIGFLLGSASGTSPGIPTAAGTLPLNVDAYFLYTLTSPNAPPLSGSLGLLDAAGHGEATLTVPAGSDPALAGITLDHAWVALAPLDLSVTLASNAVPLVLDP